MAPLTSGACGRSSVASSDVGDSGFGMKPLPEFVQDLGHGIYAVDTGFQRPRFDAAFLLVEDGLAAFIDTGTALAVPRLLATLRALGLSEAQVKWVIPTHVHLDHAGGVGLLMQHLPNAQVLVHIWPSWLAWTRAGATPIKLP
jgi:glyoxylase-like metal-dependent hydrolase (beta-lactamase superfamily II)